MSDLKQRAMNILATSVQEIVGPKSLAYVAIHKAADEIDDEGRTRWAEMMFNQISIDNRRRIRSNAIEKAHEEKRMFVLSGKRREPSVDVADLSRIFGTAQTW